MPRNRSSNASPSKAPKRHAPASSGRPGVVSAGAWHDLAGVALVVLAVAMGLSLVSPSSALLADLCRTFLTYGFGVGAMLVPCGLLLYAVTFFVPDEEGSPVSARAALGLALVVTALLGILSCSGAQPATQDFSGVAQVVFDGPWAVGHGGYWGGAVAWLLLSLFGPVIALVVLAGLVVSGLVVCGLSISGIVARVRRAQREALDAHSERRSQRRQERAARAQQDAATQQLPRKAAKASGGQGTSFLGSRKTSVLRRGAEPEEPRAPRHPRLEDVPGPDEAAEGVMAEAVVDDDAGEGVMAPLPVTPGPKTARRKRGRKRAEHAPEAEAPEAAVSEAAVPDPSDPSDPSGGSSVPPWMEAAEQDGADGDGTAVSTDGAQGGRSSRASKRKAAKAAELEAEGPSETAAAIAAAAVAEEGQGSRLKAPDASKVRRPGDESAVIELPPMSLLASNPSSASSSSTDAELRQTAERLQSTIEEFGLKSRVKGWVSGPLVTTFKIEMGEGERVNKITNLEDDIALSLAATSVRIFAPIPGTSLVGIEIPNSKRNNVCLGDVLPFADGGPLQVAFGRDSEGRPTVVDLAGLPHLLVAGTTGSGKSVMLNSAIMSILMRATPDQVRLIMVDPKRVEFTGYSGLPHLYVPVVNEPQKAASALQWAVTEMERRLKIFERAGARDIKSYNKMVADGKFADSAAPPDHMPYFVIVIDELADLMMVAGKDVEASIVRIAQLGRAAGIHLIVATQRPSADVVTGLIKANIDNRVALSVDNGMNSRIILDQMGAEKLLGNGDMLVKLRGRKPKRVQGCYVSDPEIEEAVEFIRAQGEPEYHDEILSAVSPSPVAGSPDDVDEDDPLLWEAAQIVVDSQLGSTSGLQRRLKVGYARAGRIMDMLQSKGVVGPPDGSKPRDVLLDAAGLEELRSADALYREV